MNRTMRVSQLLHSYCCSKIKPQDCEDHGLGLDFDKEERLGLHLVAPNLVGRTL